MTPTTPSGAAGLAEWLDGEEFHTLCMNYRAALYSPLSQSPQHCFELLVAAIEREHNAALRGLRAAGYCPRCKGTGTYSMAELGSGNICPACNGSGATAAPPASAPEPVADARSLWNFMRQYMPFDHKAKGQMAVSFECFEAALSSHALALSLATAHGERQSWTLLSEVQQGLRRVHVPSYQQGIERAAKEVFLLGEGHPLDDAYMSAIEESIAAIQALAPSATPKEQG